MVTTSPGGVTIDMISVEAEFSDDPGTFCQLVGYRYTGLESDLKID